jgi:tetratricopeptide (TPR) repeat protein
MTPADEATALEADAAEYPDERGEILIEAAAAWREAGRPERAAELLAQLVEAGGEDGCDARVQVAEYCFADGAVDAAYAELELLSRDPALHDGHCQLTAELLAEREDLPGALRWYDRAVARLDSSTLEALRGPDAWMEMAWHMVRGRREVRERLGLPADATDESIMESPLRTALNLDDVPDGVAAGHVSQQVRRLVFQRAERAEAMRRWPDEYGPEPDEVHYPAAEQRWRELADSGVPSIRLIPSTVADLSDFAERTGRSPTDSETRAAYVDHIPGEQMIVWPPQRNSPCWCGSGTKYKKCCGTVR